MSEKQDMVWVLQINHRHGVNITAHRSKEGATTELYSFATEWWKSEVGDEDMPVSRDELIERYFEKVEGRESYELDEVELTA